jgi:hypothetical protein
MGAPTFAILSEIYFQNLKHNQIYHILTKNNILNYFRYVDDTLSIYVKQIPILIMYQQNLITCIKN